MFENIVSQLPIEILHEFQRALNSGTWSNGMRLTQKQRRICHHALFLKEIDVDVINH